MAKVVDYYFTPVSPWTYLGHGRFEQMLAKHGATVRVKPVDYGRIFPVSGGLPLKQRAAQRQAYRLVELRRFRDHSGVPLNLQPKFFPAPSDAAAQLVIAADKANGVASAMKLASALMRACWFEERNVADAATQDAIVREQGLDPDALASHSEAAKAAYDAYTQEAIDRGVFGAPSYLYNDEIFWGQDRLEFFERALEAR
jgi:2-hydroxychromene-2-carboxylate isomerase